MITYVNSSLNPGADDKTPFAIIQKDVTTSYELTLSLDPPLLNDLIGALGDSDLWIAKELRQLLEGAQKGGLR